ncbi:MAG: hypothetical protein GXX96_36395 [Planctomycetaceae bacterium]|nr:hypothetical protein [Planctomycetaceae bacterium]
MSEPSYHHTQKAPWFLLLFALAALFFTVAWVTKAEPVVPAILLVSGLLMAMLGYSMQHLTVSDEGDRLAISFGPLPLFRRRIRYDDITGVQIGRTTIMDGWGIHWSPWGGWVWSLSAGKSVVIRRRRGVIKVGTDDAEGLAEFLTSRTGGQPRPATIHRG